MFKKNIFIVFVAFTVCLNAQTPWSNGNVKVSENGRYLQYSNGKPFFWQGDTSWLMLTRLNREEVKQYFENRKAKGFNVIQCIFVQNYDHKN